MVSKTFDGILMKIFYVEQPLDSFWLWKKYKYKMSKFDRYRANLVPILAILKVDAVATNIWQFPENLAGNSCALVCL